MEVYQTWFQKVPRNLQTDGNKIESLNLLRKNKDESLKHNILLQVRSQYDPSVSSISKKWFNTSLILCIYYEGGVRAGRRLAKFSIATRIKGTQRAWMSSTYLVCFYL